MCRNNYYLDNSFFLLLTIGQIVLGQRVCTYLLRFLEHQLRLNFLTFRLHGDLNSANKPLDLRRRRRVRNLRKHINVCSVDVSSKVNCYAVCQFRNIIQASRGGGCLVWKLAKQTQSNINVSRSDWFSTLTFCRRVCVSDSFHVPFALFAANAGFYGPKLYCFDISRNNQFVNIFYDNC